MISPCAADVMAAIDATAAYLPQLEIWITDEPLPRGKKWLIDPDRSEVYIDGTVSPNEASAALIQALRHLTQHYKIPTPINHRRLQLVPHIPLPRSESMTTGTHGL